jgi:hypothetical protein
LAGQAETVAVIGIHQAKINNPSNASVADVIANAPAKALKRGHRLAAINPAPTNKIPNGIITNMDKQDYS